MRTISRTSCQRYLGSALSHGEPVLLLRFDVPTHVAIPIEDLPMSWRRKYGLLVIGPRTKRAAGKRTRRAASAALVRHLKRAKRRREGD